MKIPTAYTPRTDLAKTPLASLSAQGADANAFGASIGQGLQNAGTGITNLAEVEIAKQKKVEDFDTARRFTERQTETAEKVAEAKRAAPPNGLGTRNVIDEIHKKAYDDFMATVPERSKGEYSVKVEQDKQRTTLDAVSFEFKAADAHFTQGIADEASKAKNAVNQDPSQLEQWNRHVVETIDKSGLSEIQKEGEKRKHLGDLAVVKYKAMVRTGEYSGANLPVEGGVSVFVDRILKVESGGDPNAKNPKSTASGLGQFLDKTWVEQLRLARPDITGKLPDEALLALKLDKGLQREVTAQYATQNANQLRNAGFAPTPSNIYLAHFLGAEGAKRVLGAPDAQPIQTVVGTDAYKANKAVFDKAQTAGEVKAWAVSKMGSNADLPRVEAVMEGGRWTAPGVEYDLSGKLRPIPPSKEYVEKVLPAVKAIDPSLGIRFTSGGQKPGEGTGSHRHDVDEKGEAHTTDFVLTKGGKPVTPQQDPALYAKAVEELAAQGFTGIGHYAWGLHIGGGTRAVWGPDKTAATADPQIVAAVNRGWARAGDSKRDALDTDPAYARIPYEDRIALRADGQREAKAQLTQDLQIRQAEMKQQQDTLYTALFDGKAGQADIDRARMSGILGSYEEITKAAGILKRRDEGITLEQSAVQKLVAGGIWNPQDSDDKKMLNALVGDKGKEAIGQGNKQYFTDNVVPIVERAKDIPTDVSGTLQAMLRSNNQQQALYALDALSQLQRASPEAYADRISSEVQRDVERYTLLRNVMPQDELLRTIRGGFTQEERQATLVRRKEGEDLLAKKDGRTPKIESVVKEVVGEFDDWFSARPDMLKNAPGAQAVERFSNLIWLEEYAKHGNADLATELVKKAAKARFGVTELGGSKVLMELPPEKAGYRQIAGSHQWIDKQLKEELKLPADQKYELMMDEQTRQEYANFQKGGRPPSYNVILKDANGVLRAVFDDKGKPRRMYFQPSASDLQKELDFTLEKNESAVNEQFINEFERMRVYSKATGVPVPAELEADYNLRKGRQAEIKTTQQKRAVEAWKPSTMDSPNPLDAMPRLIEPQFPGL